ncbi:nitrogen fixation protein NifQ [Achromobacter denitrificans]
MHDFPNARSDTLPADAAAAPQLAHALLRHAPPGHPDAGFFATVLATSLAHGDLGRSGLSPEEMDALLERLFPGAPAAHDAALAPLRGQRAAYAAAGLAPLDRSQAEFTRLLRALLDAWTSPAMDTTPWVTGVLARACLRPDHLWRDLGLSGREDVTALLARHYPGLAARNVRNLRWKQFLAYSARELAGQPLAPAPGCPGCEDYGYCYPRPRPEGGPQ